jgi:hypothetical protein
LYEEEGYGAANWLARYYKNKVSKEERDAQPITEKASTTRGKLAIRRWRKGLLKRNTGCLGTSSSAEPADGTKPVFKSLRASCFHSLDSPPRPEFEVFETLPLPVLATPLAAQVNAPVKLLTEKMEQMLNFHYQRSDWTWDGGQRLGFVRTAPI